MKTKHTWLYRLSKIIVLLAILVGIYAGVSYILVCNHLRPITPIATPYLGTPTGSWGPTAFSFIHQTNERQRMLTKSKRYHGFEIDLYTQPNDPTLYVAHDPRQFKYKMTLQAAFSIPKEPAENFFWIDMKSSLTQAQIDEVKNIARLCGVPLENLIFEPPYKDDAQAKLLTQNGLRVILFITGFEKEFNAEQTQALVDKTQHRIEEIQPWGISSGMGLYPYLKAYFPNYPKAICYNTTKRPSLKKYFMRRLIAKDPSVRIFLTDEYNWDNLGVKND
ncbi:MAG: hypothetical protein IKN49_05315 [Elusimicrobiaceae bacterium]|nr:hypothetical protein [Elusimicrobiaceae bacterium]